jgi:capsular polysaccharide export protein
MGFEAILAGHRPVLAGQPFYAGWGLTDDAAPHPRRQRTLTPDQLFAAAMILYPTWYDPTADALCPLETAIAQLEAEARAFRDDARGWVATGMRAWKRKPLQAFFGTRHPVIFADPPTRAAALAAAQDKPLMAWASTCPPDLPATRVEDGFLRSRGLGADLIPPLSLCLDDLGIYYDPTRDSRLERLIQDAATLPPDALDRAERLIATLTAARLSKYNLTGQPLPAFPPGHCILIPGQVEDDASIRLGAGAIRTNRALLLAARAAHPGAVLLYKPHPDVEAGLRPGTVPDAQTFADVILPRTDPLAAIDAADEVWTITSTLGFEALLRGKPVTCTGVPFYAGWGLTTDLTPPPDRRTARPSLVALVHATLIAYPRYMDPVTRRPCPPEAAIHRLATATVPRPGPLNRALAKLQGRLATHAHLWRR